MFVLSKIWKMIPMLWSGVCIILLQNIMLRLALWVTLPATLASCVGTDLYLTYSTSG